MTKFAFFKIILGSMFKTRLFAVFMLALSSSIVGQVLELTDNDFSTRMEEHAYALVLFYAPWCGHCKRLKPEFEKSASSLAANDPPVVLAKIDCTEKGKTTCSKFDVTGYPTLKIFQNGKLWKSYDGPREADGIVSHIKSQVGPSAVFLTNDSVENFLALPYIVVIGFFSSDSELKKVFMQVSDVHRDRFRFGLAESEDIFTKYEVKDGIVLYRPKHLCNIFEDCSVQYKGEESKEELEDWLKKKQHGLVGYRQKDNRDDFKAPLVITYFYIDYSKNTKGTNYWRNRVLKVAKNFVDDFKFAISSKNDFQEDIDDFDYSSSDKPFVLAKLLDNHRYPMLEEFTVENFENFLTKLKAGELEPYIKSEPIPESNDGPLKVAVGKTFDEIVNQNDRDIFIEFYAPWCGHCKKFTPIWQEFAELMASEEIEVVKMDGTKNDVPPEYEVQGYPTLYWVPKNSKDKPVVYDGERELDDLIRYVSEYATNELKRYDRSGNPRDKTEL